MQTIEKYCLEMAGYANANNEIDTHNEIETLNKRRKRI